MTKNKYIEVYCNNEKVGEILATHSKAACKQWVRDEILSTHLGEWHLGYDAKKQCKTLSYSTTIGQYYTFEFIG